MLWSSALPMGMVLDGVEGKELDAGWEVGGSVKER